MPNDRIDVENLTGGASSVRPILYSQLRTARCNTTNASLEEFMGVLPANVRTCLSAVLRGEVPPTEMTTEEIGDLLFAFGIPLETAVPIWPRPSANERLGEAVASAKLGATCCSDGLDEFFMRIRALKAAFNGSSASR
jgi:hypothetical protein